ncbi:MAG: IcmT/TraK family protein [Alphaproteobacteria bacterium]|nr:IcmT/TraK family protein [Alphaproteobacteria bacterium]
MDIHWRNSQKPVRFFMLDARAFLGILFLLLHFRVWVLVLCIFSMFFFWAFERHGLAFGPALRAMRCWFMGARRPANARSAIRRYTDNGCR